MSDSESEYLWVRVVPVPDRSKYRFPPYWEPDDPLPGFEVVEPR